MSTKRPRELDERIMEAIASRAAPGIVSIVTHNVPEKMTVNFDGYTKMAENTIKPKDIIFIGSGMIIESGTPVTGTSNTQYLSTILAPACLFQHLGIDIDTRVTGTSNGTSNSQYLSTILAPASLFQHLDMDMDMDTDTDIDFDVFGSTGVSYKAKLLACDFHYNLAVISIISDSPLPTVTLNHIDDTLSIDPTDHLHSQTPAPTTFQRRPLSSSFKTFPSTLIVSAWRTHIHPYALRFYSYSFSSSCPKDLSCKELYQINTPGIRGHNGGSVLDSSGQVIGIMVNYSSFLPSNIVSRWWNHYKTSGRFRRPLVGMEVVNLHDADLDFLTQFITIFPKISSAVVVTKVKEDSPACISGIRTNDVIVKLDDKLIESKLQFYETIWDKVGQVVEVNVVRATGEELNLSLAIKETSPNNFHQWPHPHWQRVIETKLRGSMMNQNRRFRGRNQPLEVEIEEPSEWNQHIIKLAALRASPGIVSIVSHNVPEDMSLKIRGLLEDSKKYKDIFFTGSGIIIESSRPAGTDQFLSTILAPASVFQHYYPPLDTHPDIDVLASTGVLYKAQLLACDFHYNLAAISITSDSPLPTVTLKHIDDTLSILPTHHLRFLVPDNTSPSFKVAPKTKIISVWREHIRPYSLILDSGSFSSSCKWGISCKELCQINDITYVLCDGGAVLDPTGRVIGITFNNSSFLPSNIVSRWWNHYKSSGVFHHPYVGMEVANLHDTDNEFRAKFMIIFPEISAAMVVTKVKKDSPARRSEIRTNDVIVKIDDKLVRSKLEFYETIWEKVGKTVTVNVLRVTDYEELNLSLVIEETPSNKVNEWPHPNMIRIALNPVPKQKTEPH